MNALVARLIYLSSYLSYLASNIFANPTCTFPLLANLCSGYKKLVPTLGFLPISPFCLKKGKTAYDMKIEEDKENPQIILVLHLLNLLFFLLPFTCLNKD